MANHVESPEAAEARVAAAAALAESLRSEIANRAKSQQQIVVLTAALVGIVASLAGAGEINPLIYAALAVVFLVLALVVLRHDQEITVIAAYLLDPAVFGPHARLQEGWERHKYTAMQIENWKQHPLVAAPGVATYGMPVGAGVVFSLAPLISGPEDWHWIPAVAAPILLILFGIFFYREVKEMMAAYRRIGGDR